MSDNDSDPQLKKALFYQNASITDAADGQKYLGVDDFVRAIAPPNETFDKISRDSYAALFAVADRSGAGRVGLNDWLLFDSLLERPDAEYQIAFRVFDRNGRGYVDFREFVDTYNQNRTKSSVPFDWDGKWASLYLGESGNRHTMSYQQFSQMLSGLVGERARQAFQYFDAKNTGFISPEQFETMFKTMARHKLSDRLLDSLHTVINRPSSQSPKVSYATVRAFLNLINRVELVELIARQAAQSNGDFETFTRSQFMENAARIAKFATFTPLEVDLLFHFARANPRGLSVQNTGAEIASIEGFNRMFDPLWQDEFARYRRSEAKKVQAAKNFVSAPRGFLSEVFENVYNFSLGSIAGAFGATVVYPIDLVKTRMQNQRKSTPGTKLLYKNSIDCFRKVVRHEGVGGLYRGLGPQLVGVAPEKAIKLTVNDLVRGLLTDKNGNLPLWSEIVAGGSAGACQVVFTNPLEIVKIRLQVQGQMQRAAGEAADDVGGVIAKAATGKPNRQSAITIVRQLGLVGLYKGATACLMRDVPFSAIYFPTYAHLKKDYFGEGPKRPLKTWELLTAGAIAGIPAAYLTTPFDVIKTRLQVESRKGETSYRGLRHAAATIYKEEGFTAFFKGGPARIFRSSPQFGCTLAAYEVLKRLMPFPGSHSDSTEAGHSVPTAKASADEQPPMRYLRSRNSLKVLLDIDENFGKPASMLSKLS